MCRETGGEDLPSSNSPNWATTEEGKKNLINQPK